MDFCLSESHTHTHTPTHTHTHPCASISVIRCAYVSSRSLNNERKADLQPSVSFCATRVNGVLAA